MGSLEDSDWLEDALMFTLDTSLGELLVFIGTLSLAVISLVSSTRSEKFHRVQAIIGHRRQVLDWAISRVSDLLYSDICYILSNALIRKDTVGINEIQQSRIEAIYQLRETRESLLPILVSCDQVFIKKFSAHKYSIAFNKCINVLLVRLLVVLKAKVEPDSSVGSDAKLVSDFRASVVDLISVTEVKK